MPSPARPRVPADCLVVIGGSAGGLEALRHVLRGLPLDLPAAVCVVLHLPRRGTSVLPDILARVCGHDVAAATDGEPLLAGSIRVAVPDRHLVIRGGRIGVVLAPRENRHRPALDPLFRTAARAFGPRVVSVVLSGALDDGTAGTTAVHLLGGLTIAQDPDDAVFRDMPANAIATGRVRRVAPADGIGALIREALEQLPSPMPDDPGAPQSPVVDASASETDELFSMPRDVAEPVRPRTPDRDAKTALDPPGQPSAYSCPDCGGVLWIVPGSDDHFRCRVGHRFTHDGLDLGQDAVIEDALWTALRALEEQASLAERVARRATDRHDRHAAARFTERATDAVDRAQQIRDVLRRVTGSPGEPGDGEPPDRAPIDGEPADPARAGEPVERSA